MQSKSGVDGFCSYGLTGRKIGIENMENGISVIVPVYNAEQFLTQCIESILHQSWKEIELILVDDGSTDGSGAICDVYAKRDKRIKVFHQKNQGPIEARRKGLMESRCNYVTYVDADDFIAPVSYALAEFSMQRETDVIIFGITRYFHASYQKLERCGYREGIYHKKDIEEIIWPQMIWNREKEYFGMDPSLCNKIMKRNLLISCFEKLECGRFHLGEDAAIVFPLLKEAETVEIIEQSYYYHRQRNQAVLAKYYTDAYYFDKLYLLYQFLMRQFGTDEMFVRQIEYYYMHSVNLRKQVYGDDRRKVRWLFPFDLVDKGDRIILYGAGQVGWSYVEQLKQLKYAQIVLWADKNYQRYGLEEISSVEKIMTVSYDKIIIAIENQEVRKSVRDDLIQMGVNGEKVIG